MGDLLHMKKFSFFAIVALTGLLGASSVSATQPTESPEFLAKRTMGWGLFLGSIAAEINSNRIAHNAQDVIRIDGRERFIDLYRFKNRLDWAKWAVKQDNIVHASNPYKMQVCKAAEAILFRNNAMKTAILALGAVAAWKISKGLYCAYTKTDPAQISASRWASRFLKRYSECLMVMINALNSL